MQVLYMHHQSGKELQEKDLFKAFDRSLDELHRMFLYYIEFVRQLEMEARRYDDHHRDKARDDRNFTAHLRLAENPLVAAIAESKEVDKALSKNNIQWNLESDEDLIKRLFLDIKNSEIYEAYSSQEENDENHLEILLHIYKHYSENFPAFEQHMEENFSNFQDDKKLVFSMFRKSLQNLAEEKNPFLVTLVQDKENTIGFGRDLIKIVLEKEDELKSRIEKRITKWEPKLIALTDRIILKMGLAELLYFPSIPPTVTINEYVEISKNYSPPGSNKFVNGVLDGLKREL